MNPGKTIAIHQPNFLPWLGYFHKILKSDVFVFLDDVEYTKNGFINRNRIKTPQGEQWITLPVHYAGKSRQMIREVEIVHPGRSSRKILATIEMNYKKAEFFDPYFNELSTILQEGSSCLADLNIRLIRWICEKLGSNTQFIKSSDLDIHEDDPTERLAAICNSLDGQNYISGFGGDKYQERQRFEDNNIQLIPSRFKSGEYMQLWGAFIPNLSVIDGLLNLGPSLINNI